MRHRRSLFSGVISLALIAALLASSELPLLISVASAMPDSASELIQVVSATRPSPPGSMSYSISGDTITIDFKDGVPFGGNPTGQARLTIRVLDPITKTLEVTLQHISGCTVTASVCGQTIEASPYHRGTATARKVISCSSIKVSVNLGIMNNARRLTNSGSLELKITTLPLEKYPQAIIGTRIIFNETLGKEKPIIYRGPVVEADQQYITYANMTVRKLILPPDVYELLPDYAVKGYLYSLADGGFAFGKWEGLSGLLWTNAKWVEGPTWHGSPDDPAKISITGKIEVSPPTLPTKFPFVFGTVYTTPPKMSNITVADFDNLIFTLQYIPDPTVFGMPWVSENAKPEDIASIAFGVALTITPYAVSRKLAERAALNRILAEIDKEVAQRLAPPAARVIERRLTTVMPLAAVSTGLYQEIVDKVMNSKVEIEDRKNAELVGEIEQIYSTYVAPDPEHFRNDAQLQAKVLEMVNQAIERKAAEASAELDSKIQNILGSASWEGVKDYSTEVLEDVVISIPPFLLDKAGALSQASVYGTVAALAFTAVINVAYVVAEKTGIVKDPAGVSYVPVLIFNVKDEATGQKYLVYKALVPKQDFGVVGLGCVIPGSCISMQEIVARLMAEYKKAKGDSMIIKPLFDVYDKPEQILVVAKQGFSVTFGEMIESATGVSASRLVIQEVGFASLYVPYVTSTIFDLGTRHVFYVNAVERGRTMRLTGVKRTAEVVTDPNRIAQIIGPVLVNGIANPDWKVDGGKAYITLHIGLKGSGATPLSFNISTFNPESRFFADVELQVDHYYMINLAKSIPTFGIPCVIDPTAKEEKQFVGFLKIVRFELYYIRGSEPTKPPDQIYLMILSNETLELSYTGGYRPKPGEEAGIGEYESRIYTSPLVLKPITGPLMRGYEVIIGRDVWTWSKVDEMNISGVTWYIWDGMAAVEKIPMIRFITKCGIQIRITVPTEISRFIRGDILLNGEQYQPLPTRATFIFYTDAPSQAWAEVSLTVGVYSNAMGSEQPYYVPIHLSRLIGTSGWTESYKGYSANRITVDITDVTNQAMHLSAKLNRAVYIVASARIVRVPEGFTKLDPQPKAVPVFRPMPTRGANLTVYVVDSLDRSPINGAFVTVQNKSAILATGVTNANDCPSGGCVKFVNLPEGAVRVNVTATGYAPYSSGESVVLRAGTETELTVELRRLPPTNATLTVIVYDAETNAKLQGARVEVTNGTQAGTYVKYTGSDGVATFSLRLGTYALNVYMEGYEKHTETIQLESNMTVKVPLYRLLPRYMATVKVLGAVSKNPIQGALVAFENGTTVYSNYTDQNGIARITLPKGGYNLRIEASGYNTHTETITIVGNVYLERLLAPLSLTPEPPIPPNTPPEQCPVSLTTIKVVDIVTGAPVEGADILLERGFKYTGRTDSKGEAKFCISSGSYGFVISHPLYQTKSGTSFFVAGNSYTFELTPLSGVPRARLIVEVRDASNGTLISGARVQIGNATAVLEDYTGADGRAAFVLTVGGYWIRVSKPFYYEYYAEFRFPANNDSLYVVSLQPMAGVWIPPGSNYTVPSPMGFVWLAVDVRYRDGAPFQGAYVYIYNGTGFSNLAFSGQTDGRGLFEALLRHNQLYKLNVTAINRGQRWTVAYVFNASASYRLVFYTPWMSNFTLPEVGVTGVRFVDLYGVWGQEHIIGYNIISSLPQKISLRVEAINYTRLVKDGVEQVLAYKEERDVPVGPGLNTLWSSLVINGSGWTMVAPRVKIIAYQNDTDPTNNVGLGMPIPFGPIIDIRLDLYVYLKSWRVAARYPGITSYAVEHRILSDYDVPGLATLTYGVEYISAETMRYVSEAKVHNVTVVKPVKVVNETLVLPWTNVVNITSTIYHPYDMFPQNNIQTFFLELDEAVKFVNVSVPSTVFSGKKYNVTVTMVANKYVPNWYVYVYSGNMTPVGEKYVDLYFGVNNVVIEATARRIVWYKPLEIDMITVGTMNDGYPEDNTYTAQVMVVNENWMSIFVIIGVIGVGIVGTVAVYKAARHKEEILLYEKKRRAIHRLDYAEPAYAAESLAPARLERQEGERRRRTLRRL